MLMYQRDNIHKKAIQSKDPQAFEHYRQCRNKTVKAIRRAKKEYYTNQISQSKGSRQTWKTLRGLLKSKKGRSHAGPGSLPDAANVFNDFFATVGPNLSKKIPEKLDYHWTQPDCIHTFTFSELYEDDIHKDLRSLPQESNMDILGV
jgi:hypothetical protein